MNLETHSTYFSAIAGGAATLLGLSFFALIFFLTELFHRFDKLAIPVYLQELQSRARKRSHNMGHRPEHVTDYGLFDSDPLVVFSAFSVGVSWNMYFASLVVSLTAVSGLFGIAWWLAAESFAFWLFLTISMRTRNTMRHRLATYRTWDEHYWEWFEWAFVSLWLAATVLIVVHALRMDYSRNLEYVCRRVLPSPWCRIDTALIVLPVLKCMCLGGICFGLYITNKDLFVYLKVKASDEMRERWLQGFVDRYPVLERQVTESMAKSNSAAVEKLWNNGCPPSHYIRDGFSPGKRILHGKRVDSGPDGRWKYLLDQRTSVASWMFDVPGIATWESELKELLEGHSRS